MNVHKICGVSPTQLEILALLCPPSAGVVMFPRCASELGSERGSPHRGAIRVLLEKGYVSRQRVFGGKRWAYSATPQGIQAMRLVQSAMQVPPEKHFGPTAVVKKKLEVFHALCA